MRLGGAQSGGGDPLTMSAAGNDYAELCDLGPSRWSSRGYHPPHSSLVGGGGGGGGIPPGAGGGGGSHLRSNSFEAEDIVVPGVGGAGSASGVMMVGGSGSGVSGAGGGNPYGISARIGNSTSSLRGRSGLYYSPPGTSYTIVERPHSPHYYYNTAGVASKGGSLPSRGTYLSSSSSSHIPGALGVASSAGAGSGVAVPNSSRHNGKKRPISPEQVLRMFGSTTSASVPTSYHYSNGTRDRGRRSPASSPPSTTHQIYRERERDRDRSIPNIHELSTRTVTMSRDQQPDGSHGFGICVKGGKDSGVGVYISRIEEGSVAERAGLRPGDTILEVNGTPFTSISHDEALKRCVQILKSSRQISMTVRAPPILNSTAPLHGFGPPSRDPTYASTVPLIPPPQSSALSSSSQQMLGGGGPLSPPFRQTCSWMDRQGRPASPPMEYGGRRSDRRDRIRRVELLIEPGQSLGLMIRGGVEYGLGIFITGVDKDSVADRAGLMVGDEILEVNGQSFLDVTHDEAVSQLKYHKRMSLVVRDVGKVPHSCTSIEPEPWDAYSPTGTRSRRKCPVSAMVEEKARSLLPRHQFASLSYYISEYGAKAMTIDAFVAVLLEMLDTPEKHTLVTEIRELVFPEDRTRYDELVYRRDRDAYSIERHRRKGDSMHGHEMPVSDVDLEVIEATGRSPSSDSGLGLTVPADIRNRPACPLPYRPLSAGPILHRHYHHHSSLRQLGGSQSRLTPTKTVGTNTPTRFNPLNQSTSSAPAGSKTEETTDAGNAQGDTGGGSADGGGGSTVNNIEKKDYNCDEPRSRRGSETQIPRTEYEQDSDQGGYLDGLRSHLGGLTQRVKSWYWGRPLELATKLSRSFDMKEEGGTLLGDKGVRRHQSMQRLSAEQNGSTTDQTQEHNPNVVPDHRGNLHITVKKTKPILGIAIEGGANTKHPLPRIINIHEHGAAYEAGGLEVGQLILEVDGHKVEGMHHQDVARLIAECFANRDKSDITFLVIEAKKSNLEPKPTALIFLEA
ncbi:whirlin isoform X2 [Hermetia illucens]|uniref:whirlin isoform X2 n=1 Tax=Hermetia illucens TaxID=343691 RepID=UPI0018CC3767|nr:whirlin isoform X2 [Hermetia illucens]